MIPPVRPKVASAARLATRAPSPVAVLVGIQDATTGAQETGQGTSLEQWAAYAQIISAVAAGISAVATAVLAVAVFLQIRAAREEPKQLAKPSGRWRRAERRRTGPRS